MYTSKLAGLTTIKFNTTLSHALARLNVTRSFHSTGRLRLPKNYIYCALFSLCALVTGFTGIKVSLYKSNKRVFNYDKLFMSANCEGSEADQSHETHFYPPITPFLQATLQVSKIHSVAYSLYGNPKGIPVLFVHGGPGGGTDPAMARYFDPKAYLIILVDQRGCGESKPFACLEENTTPDLVEDFEKIRKHLDIEKWMLFGGSWGSTLSLAYAISHPERVTKMVLRGIFLCRDKELKWMYQGPGASEVFPEDWAMYEAAIPEAERGDYIAAYGKRLRGELGDEEMYKAATAWSTWEGRISKLVQDPWEKINKKYGSGRFPLAFARIENHYFTNQAFFPRDGYLLEPENIAKISHIPTIIAQGRYDMVCPAVSAYDLVKKLENAELIYGITGHSSFEKGLAEILVQATDRFKNDAN